MNNKKGFTLIELLAVIIILAVIGVIAIPNLFRVIQNSREKTIENTAILLGRAAEDYYTNQLALSGEIDKISLTDETLEYRGERPEVGYAYFDEEGRAYLKMYYDGYCVIRNYDGKVEYEKTSVSGCPVEDMVSVTIYLNGGDIAVNDDWSIGEGYASIIIEFGSHLEKLPEITKIGHTLKGLFDEEDKAVNLSNPIIDNIILTAKWEANKYVVDLDLAGGTVDGTYEEIREIEYGTAYGELPTPTRPGYDFLGWYTAGGIEVTSETLLTNPNDHTITAQWEAINYEIILDAKGGTFLQDDEWVIEGERASREYLYAAKYEGLLTPVKTGYTFIGWKTEGGRIIDENTIVQESIVAEAQWQAETVIVKFNSSGGSTVEAIEVTYDDKYGELPIPTKTGYEFLGWKLQNGSLITKDDIVNFEGEITLYADWKLVVFTITFDAGEGTIPASEEYTVINSNTATKQVTYEQEYGILPEPVREGYTFTGWITTGGVLITEDLEVSITENQTVIAQWGQNEYTVAFDPLEGTVDIPAILVHYDAAYGELPEPVRKGYSFKGWYYNGSEITSTSIVKVAEIHTLVAKWEVDTYTVTFKYNDEGVTADTTKEVTYDSAYGTLPSPTRSGYIFNGWATVDGTPITEDTKVTMTESHDIIAQWTKIDKFTLTFDSNGGTLFDSMIVQYGQPYGSLPTPINSGYEFKGWYTSNTDGSIVNSSTIVTSTSDHTIYAQWEDKTTYGVVYYDIKNGGVCNTSGTVQYHIENSTLGYNGLNGNENQTSCLKFYAMNQSKTSLILDHNTTSTVQWAASSTSSGPTIALAKLKADTDGWTGITKTQTSYSDPAGYTVTYNKARFITAQEVASITGQGSWTTGSSYFAFDSACTESGVCGIGENKFAWLFDRTGGCTSWGAYVDEGPSGYWTSSSHNTNIRAWRVGADATLYRVNIDEYSDSYGIRPVIDIDY